MESVYLIGDKSKNEGKIAFLSNDFFKDDNKFREYIKKNKTFPCAMFLKNYIIKKSGIEFYEDNGSIETNWTSIIDTELAIPIFSEQFKECIDNIKQPKDSYSWMPVKVSDTKETRLYYAIYFFKLPDVLDKKHTSYVSWNSILRPCFSLDKCHKYTIFMIKQFFWECPHGLYVTESVKQIIKKTGMKDILFEKSFCSE